MLLQLLMLLPTFAGRRCRRPLPRPFLQEHEHGMRRLLNYALALEGEVSCTLHSSHSAAAGLPGALLSFLILRCPLCPSCCLWA